MEWHACALLVQQYHLCFRLSQLFTRGSEISSLLTDQRDLSNRLNFPESIAITLSHSCTTMDENGADHCPNDRLSAQISTTCEQQQQSMERSKRRKCHGNRKPQRVRRRCHAQALKDHVVTPLRHHFNTERMDTTTSGPSTEV